MLYWAMLIVVYSAQEGKWNKTFKDIWCAFVLVQKTKPIPVLPADSSSSGSTKLSNSESVGFLAETFLFNSADLRDCGWARSCPLKGLAVAPSGGGGGVFGAEFNSAASSSGWELVETVLAIGSDSLSRSRYFRWGCALAASLPFLTIGSGTSSTSAFDWLLFRKGTCSGEVYRLFCVRGANGRSVIGMPPVKGLWRRLRIFFSWFCRRRHNTRSRMINMIGKRTPNTTPRMRGILEAAAEL